MSKLNTFDLSKRRSDAYKKNFPLELHFFRTRYKVLLESTLEQILSTVILVRIKQLSDKSFGRKIRQKKMTIFVLFLKHSQRIHSTILHPNFKTIVLNITISLKYKLSVLEHQTSLFKVGSMVSLRDLLVIP